MVRLPSFGRDLAMTCRETSVLWSNGELTGEGLFYRAKGNSGVVICHPHPQMGGSMHNNVVETISEVFAKYDFSTLRFNFRGVGKSTGQFDEGAGEQQDVMSACRYLESQGITKILLAGYSFGAWVCSLLLKRTDVRFEKTLLISPPDAFVAFDWTGLEHAVDLIVCGSYDDFCNAVQLQHQSKILGATFVLMEKADHFYSGVEARLAEHLERFIQDKAR